MLIMGKCKYRVKLINTKYKKILKNNKKVLTNNKI